MDKTTLIIRSQELFQEANNLKVKDDASQKLAEKMIQEAGGAVKECLTLSLKKPVLYFQNASNLVSSKLKAFVDTVEAQKSAVIEHKRQIEENTRKIQAHQKFLEERSVAKTDEHVFHDKKNEMRKESFEEPNQAHISHSEVKKRLGRPKGLKAKEVK